MPHATGMQDESAEQPFSLLWAKPRLPNSSLLQSSRHLGECAYLQLGSLQTESSYNDTALSRDGDSFTVLDVFMEK